MWELGYKESWVPKNWCFWTVVLEKTLESPLNCKEIQTAHPKGNQSWIFIGRTNADWNSNTLSTWCQELTHWKRLWCWERLKAGGERDDREWDGWMASLTWVWVNSKNWWWTGKPGMLHSIGSQRVRHDWETELNWYAEYKEKWYKWTYLQNSNRLRLQVGTCQGEWWMEGILRELGMGMYTLLYFKWITTNTYYIAHGTLLNVMWEAGWEGSLGESGYMHLCDWALSLYSWSYHNIVC